MADEISPLTSTREKAEGLGLDEGVLRIEKGRTRPFGEAAPEARAPKAEHIPWGYGQDRVTAVAVDPNRLYVYWEATDPAIERARRGLGAGGKDAWMNLRVYDITGRIFDGTNAHSYVDIKIERSDRQWFANVGKPASTHCIEVGLKSLEGYFVKIARSGRVDFPRFEPSADSTVDWLTVRPGTGPMQPFPGAPPGPGAGPGGGGGGGGGGEVGGAHASGGPESAAPGEGSNVSTSQSTEVVWHELHEGGVQLHEWSWTGWQELFRTQWIEGRRFLEWSSPLFRTSWDSGPFSLPVDAPSLVQEHYEGPVTVYPLEGGRTRVVYGPWQVVIRGIGAHAEGRVLARWQLETSWVVSVGFERVVSQLSAEAPRAAEGAVSLGGASEALGASERHWLSASELRLRGASELHMLGASELRMRGSSEVILGGGSERRLIGASERRLLGASEVRLGGASEKLARGASENIGRGASERMGGSERMGASERAGASERMGASEHWGTVGSGPYAFDPREKKSDPSGAGKEGR